MPVFQFQGAHFKLLLAEMHSGHLGVGGGGGKAGLGLGREGGTLPGNLPPQTGLGTEYEESELQWDLN